MLAFSTGQMDVLLISRSPFQDFFIEETGRSFNTRIKEHKACQRLGDGDKSAIVKHAQQQHKITWKDSSLITSIPHWHTRRVREAIEILQHNTVPQDSGLHINDIWHPLLQKTDRNIEIPSQPQQFFSELPTCSITEKCIGNSCHAKYNTHTTPLCNNNFPLK